MRRDDFLKKIEEESRRIEDGKRGNGRLWHYVIAACSVGWLVVIPTIGGAYLGRYIDGRLGTHGYWTISLMVLGLFTGIFWIWRENFRKNGKGR